MESVAVPIYQERSRAGQAGVLRGVVVVDAADAHFLTEHHWVITGRYARRSTHPDGRLRWVSLHRVILGLGLDDPRHVDHVNGNPLDNRRANLRIATHAQNMQNRRLHKNNRSGYRGVHRDKGRWRATVTVDKRIHRLGYFVNKEEAALAAAEFRARHMPFSVEPLPAAAS